MYIITTTITRVCKLDCVDILYMDTKKYLPSPGWDVRLEENIYLHILHRTDWYTANSYILIPKCQKEINSQKIMLIVLLLYTILG